MVAYGVWLFVAGINDIVYSCDGERHRQQYQIRVVRNANRKYANRGQS